MSTKNGSARWIEAARAAIARFGAGRALMAALIGVGLAGLMAGYGISKIGVAQRLKDLGAAFSRDVLHTPQKAVWEHYDTHLGDFEFVRLSLFRGEDLPLAAVEDIDGHLVFLTQRGRLSELNGANELHDLGLQAPMHAEEALAANLHQFNPDYFRALDLLAIETAPHAFDLYVSFDRYNPARRCFEVVVDRLRIEATPAELRVLSDWEEIYATRPCAPPRTGEAAFIGIQSGGRLVRYDARTILLSVGDLEFDGAPYPGVTELINAPQAPDWDLGKIIAIDTETGRAAHWAQGFRNPQGLLVDNAGRVWETEHGPYGGDEINLVARGHDYGWPTVSYGMRYVPQGQNWPLNPTHGGHEGFERPAYVFVPSIGISQLIQPSAEEFPFWENVLLVTSMRARNLYAARVDGDRIVYAEPLPLGERLRDIISRPNGEIAIVTDLGSLIRIRAPTETDDHAPVQVADTRARQTAPLSPAAAGERVFAANCQSCHSLQGAPGVGPALDGVIGRDVASTDFSYSATLRGQRGDWTRSRLVDFLEHPESYEGTSMPAPHLDHEQAEQVVAYLNRVQQH